MGPEVNDHVSLQWPLYEQPHGSNLRPQRKQTSWSQIFITDHHLDGYSIIIIIIIIIRGGGFMLESESCCAYYTWAAIFDSFINSFSKTHILFFRPGPPIMIDWKQPFVYLEMGWASTVSLNINWSSHAL